ncbi:MAG: hypothetical protein RR065_00925, partial [Clostridia bacterium]
PPPINKDQLSLLYRCICLIPLIVSTSSSQNLQNRPYLRNAGSCAFAFLDSIEPHAVQYHKLGNQEHAVKGG